MGDGALSRRDFLERAARWSAALGGGALLLGVPDAGRLAGLTDGGTLAADPLVELARRAPAARYWASAGMVGAACTDCHTSRELRGRTAHDHRPRTVKCLLCAHGCVIPEGERGRCRARMNVAGELRSLVYGRPITEQVDPIEKKPFFHFLPGAEAYSLATSGCPLRCRFCQNWTLSQASPEDYEVAYCPPSALANRARGRHVGVIAFTYNEPTVFVEYLTDIARAARPLGLRCVLVSCGFMNEAPLAEMVEVLDAIKIDLKGFSPDFYRKVSQAELSPVLRSIKQVARSGRHLEIVNLVVPTLNDDPALLADLCAWVAGEVGPDVPLHFTRFHPDYQLLNLPPTPVATLDRARELALKRGLRFVYVGNVPGHPGNNTYCPKCGQVVIERTGFLTTAVRLVAGACPACKTPIPGVWS